MSTKNIFNKINDKWKKSKLIVFLGILFMIIINGSDLIESLNTIRDTLFCEGCFLGSPNKKEAKFSFDLSKKTYNILLFPFQPLEKCSYKQTNIEEAIKIRLLEMNEKDSLNLQIIFDSTACINSYIEAKNLGSKYKANLVIWGDLYEHCSGNNEACLKYLTIDNNEKGKTGIEELVSLAEIKGGKLQNNIDNIIYWVAASRSIYFEKNPYKGLSYLKIIETSYEKTVSLYHHLAYCYYEIDSISIAKKYILKAMALAPDNAAIHFNYAVTLNEEYKLNGRKNQFTTDLIKEQFEISIRQEPSNAYYQYNYGNFLLTTLKDTASAKKYISRALKTDPQNAIFNREYAKLLLDAYQDKINAKYYYEKSLKSNSIDEETNYEYANLLSSLGDNHNAKKYYSLAIQINPNHDRARVNLALKFMNENNHDQAKLHFEEALKVNPNNLPGLNGYAIFLREKYNDLEKSKMFLLKAIKIDTNYLPAILNYAVTLDKSNNIAEAQKYYRKALSIDPNSDIANAAYGTFLYSKKGDRVKAAKYFIKAIEIAPNNGEVHYNYAQMLSTNGADRFEAKKHYEISLKLLPNYALAHYNYAVLLRTRFKEIDTSKYHYLKAISIQPSLRTQKGDLIFLKAGKKIPYK